MVGGTDGGRHCEVMHGTTPGIHLPLSARCGTIDDHQPESIEGTRRLWSANRNSCAGASTVAGIGRALELDMHVVTNTTLTRANAPHFPRLLQFGKQLGLKNMACNDLICSGRGTRAKQDDGLGIDKLKNLLSESAKACSRQPVFGYGSSALGTLRMKRAIGTSLHRCFAARIVL